MRHGWRGKGALVLLFALVGVGYGSFPALGAEVVVGQEVMAPRTEEVRKENVFLLGLQKAVFKGVAEADVSLLSGGEVVKEGVVGGDVLAAAAQVLIAGTTTGDLRAGGKEVRLQGRVGGDALFLASDRVVVDRGARVGGDVVAVAAGLLGLLGGSVEVDGQVEGKAYLHAPVVVLKGTLKGTTTVAAPIVVVKPSARVAVLRHPPGARVLIEEGAEVHKSIEDPSVAGGGSPFSWRVLLLFLAGWVSAVVVGALTVRFLAPRLLRRALLSAHHEFLWSALWGSVVLFSAPFVVGGLLVSGIGTVVGVAAGAVVAFVGVVGAVVAGLVGSFWARDRWLPSLDPLDWRWVVIAAAGGALLPFVPFVGWVLWIVFWFAAVGSIARALWQAR